jgi:hypothetical protein
MTLPNAKAIEGSTKLTGIQRDWVKSYVAEIVAGEIHKIKSELLEEITKASGCQCEPRVSAAERAIQDLVARYEEDDKFTLTRAKLLRFMKEQGL